MHRPLYAGIVACLVGAVCALPANAQSAQGSASANSSTDEDTLQEVIVTAERREENVQKTPMNVTVVSGDEIEKQGLSNMQEILQAVPGVTIQGQVRGFDPSIRGLGTDLPPGSSQGAVAVEEDYVYDIRAESGRLGYYDMQRVEVLAGPQGTLYGVNSDGGVVNIITNNPDLDKFSASGAVSFGNFNLVHGEGALNMPIGSTAALRVAATAINEDGYMDTGASDDVAQGARAKFLWKPNDGFSLLLGYEVAKLGGKGAGSAQSYQNGDCHHPYDPFTASYTYVSSCLTDATSPVYGIPIGGTNAGGTVQSDADQWDKYHSNKYWAEVKWDVGFANISFTPSYKSDYDSTYACGMGLCTIGGDPAKLQQNSEELKISQPTGSRVQWDVGVYHWGYLEYTFGGGPAGSYYQTSNAVFGEVTVPVTDQFRIKLGARENQSWKTQTNAVTPLTFHHFDYRGGVEYDVAPESMLYATVSTGYRPGGYNAVAPVVETYKTEEVTSYEIGSKNRFLQDRLQINLDAFYYHYANYQLTDFYGQGNLYCNQALNPPLPPTIVTDNFQARNLGVEMSGAFLVTQQDTVSVSAAWMNNKFTSGGTIYYNPVTNCQAYDQGLSPSETNTVVSQVVSSEVQPHSPTMSGNASWEHRFPLGEGANIAVRPSMSFTSGYYIHPEENAFSYQPSFQKYDLSATYNAPDGKWSLAVWGRNLGNYIDKTSYTPFILDEPRTYGATVSAKY